MPSAPLVPSEQDDAARHTPGDEPLWNESWYFDAIGDDHQLGFYVRLGRLPNQGGAMFGGCVCGPGRPSVMFGATVPLPPVDDDAQTVDADGVRATQVCEAPLERWRVTGESPAQAHADQSAPLRGEPGEPTTVAYDLVFETDGVPYRWRHGNRYEIPCRVSGTVTVGGETHALRGIGQRDHSWGARDWWAVDWMWSALHLDDGTHLHAVGIPGVSKYSVGYVQRDGALSELTTVVAADEVAPDGLPTRSAFTLGPDAPDLTVEPLAYGCLRLDSDDGRVSEFPRAMCRVTTDDGRAGVGWVEWNRNRL